jgi:hypothetical protein
MDGPKLLNPGVLKELCGPRALIGVLGESCTHKVCPLQLAQAARDVNRQILQGGKAEGRWWHGSKWAV